MRATVSEHHGPCELKHNESKCSAHCIFVLTAFKYFLLRLFVWVVVGRTASHIVFPLYSLARSKSLPLNVAVAV